MGNNEYKLTRREIEILLLVSEGIKNKEIAEILFITPHTVEIHKANLLKKLNLKNSLKLICFTVINKEKIKSLQDHILQNNYST